MNWTDIDFADGWSIQRIERIVGYRTKVLFKEPLDLRRLMALRRVCPGLQNRSVSELKASLLGVTELSLDEIRPAEIDSLRKNLESAGFTLKISPQNYLSECPVHIKGKHAVSFDIEDESTREELVGYLESLSVPLAPASVRPIRIACQGDRSNVLRQVKDFLEYKPRARPNFTPPPLERGSSPTFKYIDESILEHYVQHDWCPGCGVYTNVFWLLRELIIDGKSVDAESACVGCLRRHQITEYDANRTRNSIRSLVKGHYKKVDLSEAEREEKIEGIFVEFMATPKLPNFIQNVDWPCCCGDFTQFIGDAGHTYDVPFENFEWWGDEKDSAVDYGIEGMMGGEDRVSLFRCLNCSNRYWTFQCT